MMDNDRDRASKAVRVAIELYTLGEPVVCLTIGDLSRLGTFNEIAMAELPPGMARHIGTQLVTAADMIELKAAEDG